MKKQRCWDCNKQLTLKKIAFKDDDGSVICKMCLPEDCSICLLVHPLDDHKKCRDNLFKILNKAIKAQDKIFNLRHEFQEVIEKRFDDMVTNWISDEDEGYGFIRSKGDEFIKKRKIHKG